MSMAVRKPLASYLKLQYPFAVVADEDGGYVITFPDLPGCMTQVEDVADIGPMAEEARQLWIETEYKAGEAIPSPTYPESYSGKFNVRLPKSLHRRLVEGAEREGVSLNQYVTMLLAQREAEHRTAPERRPVTYRVAER
jgi:predicted RNase H-like HicB family nuclease